jgi:hypothetical protein
MLKSEYRLGVRTRETVCLEVHTQAAIQCGHLDPFASHVVGLTFIRKGRVTH